MRRKCPVCRIVEITRLDIKTCGYHQCVKTWTSWTPHEKQIAQSGEDLLTPDKLFQDMTDKSADPINETDPKEHLDRILGPIDKNDTK